MKKALIHVKNIVNTYQGKTVHENLSFSVYEQEIIGLVGGSGTGKSTLLRTLIGLNKPASGSITLFDHNVNHLNEHQLRMLSRNWGVLFQNGALFSSMNILENIAFPLKEFCHLDKNTINELALMKLSLVGLPSDAATKWPNELSGGMVKRASLARALILEPRILFLDEPTAGLDPLSAAAFDQLIKSLVENLGISVVIITHDLDTLFSICTKVAVLVDKKIIIDSIDKIIKNPHPWIQHYFHGERASHFLNQEKEHG